MPTRQVNRENAKYSAPVGQPLQCLLLAEDAHSIEIGTHVLGRRSLQPGVDLQ